MNPQERSRLAAKRRGGEEYGRTESDWQSQAARIGLVAVGEFGAEGLRGDWDNAYRKDFVAGYKPAPLQPPPRIEVECRHVIHSSRMEV